MQNDKLGAVTLGLATLVMLALGLVGLMNPLAVVGPLGIGVSGASAFNELRASYGGMHLALAGCYGYGILKPVARGMALGLLAAQMAGLVLVRVASIAIDGMPSGFVFKPMTLEAMLLGLSLVALVRRRSA